MDSLVAIAATWAMGAAMELGCFGRRLGGGRGIGFGLGIASARSFYRRGPIAALGEN